MSPTEVFKFRLYIAGDAPNRVNSESNLQAFCSEYLARRHDIKIVDVLREPVRTSADDVLLTPAPPKLHLPPVRRMIGPIGDRERLLQALELSE